MKRKFLAPIATIISALASETGNGQSITDMNTDLIKKHESDSSVADSQQANPFVLARSEDSLFIAAHRSHSSHSSHYSGSGGSGSSYSPSYSSPSYSSPSQVTPSDSGSTPSNSTQKYTPATSSTNVTGQQGGGFQENIAKCRAEEVDFHRMVLITDYAGAEKMWEKLKSCVEQHK